LKIAQHGTQSRQINFRSRRHPDELKISPPARLGRGAHLSRPPREDLSRHHETRSNRGAVDGSHRRRRRLPPTRGTSPIPEGCTTGGGSAAA
jgi:hypothetical protein